jgi:pseudouridine synthase
MSKKMRILSLLMRSGGFSRASEAEQAIRKGLVLVDGKPVTNPAHSVKASASVEVGGIQLEPQPLTYIILDKPAGVVCQKSLKERTVFDLVKTIPGLDEKTKGSLFCVGRLDKETEGLLIVTNDGHLEKLLTRGRIPKAYLVGVRDPLSDKSMERLREGVEIRDDDTGKSFHVKALSVKRLGPGKLEMSIDEGRKRQIRKMLGAVGNEVVSLKRVGIGKIRIENLDFKGKIYLTTSRKELRSWLQS